MSSTNLVDGPALSVLDRSGTPQIISLRELATNIDEYVAFYGYSAMSETALTSTLAALIADAVNESSSDSEEDRYKSTKGDSDDLEYVAESCVLPYLNTFYDSFELNPSKTDIPFMQSVDVIPVKTPSVYALIDYAGIPSEFPVPMHVALGNMLSNNNFALGGITTPAIGDTRPGDKEDAKGIRKLAVSGGKMYGTPVAPMATHQVVMLKRPTLFATLCANVSKEMVSDEAGIPSWRRDKSERPDVYGRGTGDVIDSVLYFLTASYRMMRLTFDDNDMVTSAVSTLGVVHPFLTSSETRRLVVKYSPYSVIFTKDSEDSRPVNGSPSGGLSDLKSFLAEPAANVKIGKPKVITDLVDIDGDKDDFAVRVLSKETDSKYTVYKDVTAVEASFDLRVINIPGASHTLIFAMDTALKARGKYMWAVGNTSRSIAKVETAFSNRFEESISPKLRDFIAKIAPPKDVTSKEASEYYSEKEREWANTLLRTAEDCVNEYMDSLPRSSLKISGKKEFTSAPQARNTFMSSVYNFVNPKKDDDK